MSPAWRSWLRWRLRAAVVTPTRRASSLLRIGRSDRASRICTRVGSASRAAITPGSLTSTHITHAYVINQPQAAESRRAAWGWDQDQRWTLARVTTLIARLFHVRYTRRGVSYLLHRLGYAPQVPAHRAAERDEQAIAAWRTQTWVKLRG